MPMLRPSLRRSFLALATVGALLPSVVHAGPSANGGGECVSSRAVNSIVRCDPCRMLKELTKSAPSCEIHAHVYDLDRGVLVQLDGGTPDSVKLIQGLAGELWWLPCEESRTTEEHELCGYCQERMHRLEKAERQRALTESGAILVLTSVDDAMVTWLREDARALQQMLQSVRRSP